MENNTVFTFTAVVKMLLAGLLAGVMAVFAPTVLRKPPPLPQYQISIPERMATDEARIKSLEERMQKIEEAKLNEHLAIIETRQEAVLALLIPVALFIFTHTLEVVQRMRGKTRTRKDDRS